jgi:perosamine synthetase
MVVTDNEALYDRVLKLKGQGLAEYRQYWHDSLGYNYRMTNIQAAIGCAQLDLCEYTLKAKRILAQHYMGHFKDSPVSWHKESSDVWHSYWMFSVTMDINEKQRNEMMRILLKDKGVETRPLFYPVHTMPMYSDKYQMHPVSERLHRTGFNIPSYPEISVDDIRYVADSIKEVHDEINR